jgi:predicted MPP superfamily phosphohydrolase
MAYAQENPVTMVTIIKFIGFIAVFLLLVFGAHYLLYTSTVRLMTISDPGIRKIFLWIIVCLAVSFFPSVLLLHLHVNIFTRTLYIISCVWLGLFVYLLMAIGLIWVIFWMTKAFGTLPNMRIVSIVFFLLVMAFAIHGFWRAFSPVVKSVSVRIDGLPEHWRNHTIVQLSDLHLGAINGIGFIKRITKKVDRIKPDLVLITGDLFDGMGGDLRSFIEPLNGLKASKGVFFVTGNHEGYLGLDKALSIISKTHIEVLDDKIAELDGLQIIGISFPEHHRDNRARWLLKESGTYDAGKPSILLYHTPTNIDEYNADRGNQQARTYWFPDTSMRLAKEMGIDLQLSGHTHKGQFFPFGLLTHAVYKGYDYGLHRDGRFQIYISSGVGTWGPPMRSGCQSEIVKIMLLTAP